MNALLPVVEETALAPPGGARRKAGEGMGENSEAFEAALAGAMVQPAPPATAAPTPAADASGAAAAPVDPFPGPRAAAQLWMARLPSPDVVPSTSPPAPDGATPASGPQEKPGAAGGTPSPDGEAVPTQVAEAKPKQPAAPAPVLTATEIPEPAEPDVLGSAIATQARRREAPAAVGGKVGLAGDPPVGAPRDAPLRDWLSQLASHSRPGPVAAAEPAEQAAKAAAPEQVRPAIGPEAHIFTVSSAGPSPAAANGRVSPGPGQQLAGLRDIASRTAGVPSGQPEPTVIFTVPQPALSQPPVVASRPASTAGRARPAEQAPKASETPMGPAPKPIEAPPGQAPKLPEVAPARMASPSEIPAAREAGPSAAPGEPVARASTAPTGQGQKVEAQASSPVPIGPMAEAPEPQTGRALRAAGAAADLASQAQVEANRRASPARQAPAASDPGIAKSPAGEPTPAAPAASPAPRASVTPAATLSSYSADYQPAEMKAPGTAAVAATSDGSKPALAAAAPRATAAQAEASAAAAPPAQSVGPSQSANWPPVVTPPAPPTAASGQGDGLAHPSHPALRGGAPSAAGKSGEASLALRWSEGMRSLDALNLASDYADTAPSLAQTGEPPGRADVAKPGETARLAGPARPLAAPTQASLASPAAAPAPSSTGAASSLTSPSAPPPALTVDAPPAADAPAPTGGESASQPGSVGPENRPEAPATTARHEATPAAPHGNRRAAEAEASPTAAPVHASASAPGSATAAASDQPTSAGPSADDLVRQVIQQARHLNLEGRRELHMRLQPPALGHLNVQVKVEDGGVTVRMTAENAVVKSLLEASLPQLQSALSEQGLRPDRLVVLVGQSAAFFDSSPRRPRHWEAPEGRRAAAPAEEQMGTVLAIGASGGRHAGLIDFRV